MKRLLMLVSVAAVLAFSIPSLARGQEDARVGTWKLDVAQSKYSPGPPPLGEVRRYEIQGRAIKVTIESTDAQGHKVDLAYVANDDGKDYPVAGLAFANSIAVRRVDARTFDMDTKKGGKVIGTSRMQVSTDGKTLTLTSRMKGAGGKPILNVAIYNKQY
jgi:hypothetical protein